MELTYDELRRIYRLEKNTSKLVEVDEDFINNLEQFIENEKKRYLSSLKNFSSSDARQFSNMKRLVEEIFLLREKKLLNKALIATHTKEFTLDNLASQEKETFRKMLDVLNSHSAIYENLFGEKDVESQNVALEILKDVPTFVGNDMKEYGPFKEGQKVELPSKVAKLFITRKLATEA
ncbi:MAG: hypothetical protein PHQ98_00795 [Candidatus ainarchaeum sp.]|nr:hypothetical protein [Candidatus ainarchaeum sp.]